MLILFFFPNDHLVWAARLPPTPLHGLLKRIRSGAWTFPPAWRARLEQSFYLPEPMPLRARAHGRLLLVAPLHPLVEKGTVVPEGDLHDLLARLEKERRGRKRN